MTFTNGTSSGTNWSLSGPTATYTGSGAGSVSGNVGGIVSDFVYNGNSEVLSFTGLTPGQQYVSTLIGKCWSTGDNRKINISVSDGSYLGNYDEDFSPTTTGQGTELRYTYTAPASGSISFTMNAVTAGTTYHFYGVTNAAIQTPAVGSMLFSDNFNVTTSGDANNQS